MLSSLHAENHEQPALCLDVPFHECSDCAVPTAENEIVCIRCGIVLEEETTSYVWENGLPESEGRASTSTDHNAGNGLLDSLTIQQGFVSRQSPGVAMILNNPRSKDAQGKRIKKQGLKDPYRAGLVADPSKGCHTVEDHLTGKTRIKFTRYDLPTLQIIKEKALQRCIGYHLDTVEQTLIAKELQRLYSNLVLTPIVDYVVLAGLLKYRDRLPRDVVPELENELTACVTDIRQKVLSCCNPKKE